MAEETTEPVRPVTDLVLFNKRAKTHGKALRAFLDRLDELVPEDMDALVETVDTKVWQSIDCTTCANCCKTMTPTYAKEDVVRIATHLKMRPAVFIDKWLKKEGKATAWVNKSTPCQFLEADKCSIYAVRPTDCAEYPHHNKRPFDEYKETYKINLPNCPATLLLIHRLKKTVERDYEW